MATDDVVEYTDEDRARDAEAARRDAEVFGLAARKVKKACKRLRAAVRLLDALPSKRCAEDALREELPRDLTDATWKLAEIEEELREAAERTP